MLGTKFSLDISIKDIQLNGSLFHLFSSKKCLIDIQVSKDGSFTTSTSSRTIRPALKECLKKDKDLKPKDMRNLSILEALYKKQKNDPTETFKVLLGEEGFELFRSTYYYYLFSSYTNLGHRLDDFDNFKLYFHVDFRASDNQKSTHLYITCLPHYNRLKLKKRRDATAIPFQEFLRLPEKRRLQSILFSNIEASFENDDSEFKVTWSDSPQIAFTRKRETSSDVPSDIAEELDLIFNSHGEVSVIKLLSYFSERIDLLMDEDYQLMFYYGLFTKNTLFKICKNDPKTVQLFLKKIDQMIYFAEALSNSQLKLFLLNLKVDIFLMQNPEEGIKKARELYSQYESTIKGKTHADQLFKNQIHIDLLMSSYGIPN